MTVAAATRRQALRNLKPFETLVQLISSNQSLGATLEETISLLLVGRWREPR
jgi:hypothetical protein